MMNFGEKFSEAEKPKPEENSVEANSETERSFEMTSEEVAEIEKTVTSAVEEELAIFSESQDEAMNGENKEGSENKEKEVQGKFKKTMALALVALTALTISSGIFAKKAEAFNLNVRFGVGFVAPMIVQQEAVYCAPQLVTVNVVDQFGNFIGRTNVVQEVCNRVVTNVVNNNVFGGGGVFIQGGNQMRHGGGYGHRR